MINYQTSQEEKNFLQKYDMGKYDRPSIASDICVFSIMKDDTDENYRKDPESRLKILMIRRAGFPYKGCLAMPGGFLMKNETPRESAVRELEEETGVKNAYLHTLDVFGKPGRDPRGWIVSHAYLALIDSEKYQVRAGSDAWKAEWYTINVSEKLSDEFDENETVKDFSLSLSFEDECVKALVREKARYENGHVTKSYEILEDDGFAFDHAIIVLRAYLKLKDQVNNDGRIVFDLMAETFTLTELQRAFEVILGKELLVSNFRRKYADLVEESDMQDKVVGHRPAKLFKRKISKFLE